MKVTPSQASVFIQEIESCEPANDVLAGMDLPRMSDGAGLSFAVLMGQSATKGYRETLADFFRALADAIEGDATATETE